MSILISALLPGVRAPVHKHLRLERLVQQVAGGGAETAEERHGRAPSAIFAGGSGSTSLAIRNDADSSPAKRARALENIAFTAFSVYEHFDLTRSCPEPSIACRRTPVHKNLR